MGVSSIEQFGLLVFRGRCFGLLSCREGTWEEECLCGPVPWVITPNSVFVGVIRHVSLL